MTAFSAWEVKDPPNPRDQGKVFYVERLMENGDSERAALCFDYGVACVIEAVMNLRDGTVE